MNTENMIACPISFPSTVAIFGKGPSLDLWFQTDLREANGEYRVCINETCQIVPGCCMAVGQDQEVMGIFQSMPANILIMTPDVLAQYVFAFSIRYHMHYGKVCGGQRYMTTPNAMRFLSKYGVRNFLMVGFDSMHYGKTEFDAWGKDSYSKIVNSLGHGWSVNDYGGGSYQIIREQILETIKDYNLNVEWFHKSIKSGTVYDFIKQGDPTDEQTPF